MSRSRLVARRTWMQGGAETPACVLYAGPGTTPDICDSECRPAELLFAAGANAASPAVLLVDATLAARVNDVHDMPGHAVIVATDDGAAQALGDRTELSLAGVADAAARHAVIEAACQAATAQFAVAQFEEEFH